MINTIDQAHDRVTELIDDTTEYNIVDNNPDMPEIDLLATIVLTVANECTTDVAAELIRIQLGEVPTNR